MSQLPDQFYIRSCSLLEGELILRALYSLGYAFTGRELNAALEAYADRRQFDINFCKRESDVNRITYSVSPTTRGAKLTLADLLQAQHREVELSDSHTAVIHKDHIKVGCTEFKFGPILELAEKIKEHREDDA